MFKAVGITLGWLFYFLGVATASGVFPIALAFTWKDLNKAGAVAGSVGGGLLALVVWLITARARFGEITVATLSDQWVSFAGNSAAIVLGGILSIGLSLWRPANFDWEKTRNMVAVKEVGDEETEIIADEDQKQSEKDDSSPTKTTASLESGTFPPHPDGLDLATLDRTYKRYGYIFSALALAITILIPVPLGATAYIFSPHFFTAVIAVIFIWLFFAFFLVVFLPVIESRHAMWRITRRIVRSVY